MSKVLANGLEDRGSIQDQVTPKTQKVVLDAALLSTLNYKVRVKDKVKQSRGRWHYDFVAIEKGSFGSPSTNVANLTNFYFAWCNLKQLFN